MPKVALIATCKGRLAHLRRALPTWLVQPDAEVVLVDYSCPEGAGDWVEATHPGVRVVRVPGQEHFQLTRARNAGAAAASAEWLGFIDADILLDPAFGAEVFPGLAEPASWHADSGTSDLAGTVLCPRAAFEAAGGYDEAMEGWGYEDVDLYRRLALAGLPRRAFPGRLLASLAHGDDLRTEHAPLKDKGTGWLVNMFYLEGKETVTRMQGGELPLEARRELYTEARRTVLESLATGLDGQLQVSTGWRTLSGPAEVAQTVVVSLRLRR